MEQNTPRHEISYHEHRVIVRLLQAHYEEYKSRLKALIAFGDLVTQEDAFDIDLLEIIEGWEGKRFGEFTRSEELPVRGKLRLYVLTPEEFRTPQLIDDPVERRWVEELLDRVRAGYEVVLDVPFGWVRQTLEKGEPVYETFTAPPSGSISDPFKLTRRGE